MDGAMARKTISYGAVAALQQSSLYLGKLLVQGAVNGISAVSTAPISAFTAATRVENFTQAFGQSGCESISIFVAQNRGAGRQDRAYQGFLRGAALTVSSGLLFSALMVLAARPLASIFLSEADAVDLCVGYLQIVGWFYFLSFIGFSYVGWFRGCGRMTVTFLGTTIQIVCRVAGTYLLVSRLGLDAVAWSTGMGWVLIVLFHSTMFLLQKKGIWPKATPAES